MGHNERGPVQNHYYSNANIGGLAYDDSPPKSFNNSFSPAGRDGSGGGGGRGRGRGIHEISRTLRSAADGGNGLAEGERGHGVPVVGVFF